MKTSSAPARAEDTVATLERLAAARGTAPEHIRCDNGPELIAHALRDWCRFNSTATAYIEPGSPWQNPFIESFNGRARDEVLDLELFDTLAEAKVILTDWIAAYNTEHPHSALGMMPPARFAERWREEHGGGPTPPSSRPTGSLREASGRDATVPANVLLAREVEGPQTVDVWTCRTYPQSRGQREVRCRHGSKQFTIARVG